MHIAWYIPHQKHGAGFESVLTRNVLMTWVFREKLGTHEKYETLTIWANKLSPSLLKVLKTPDPPP